MNCLTTVLHWELKSFKCFALSIPQNTKSYLCFITIQIRTNSADCIVWFPVPCFPGQSGRQAMTTTSCLLHLGWMVRTDTKGSFVSMGALLEGRVAQGHSSTTQAEQACGEQGLTFQESPPAPQTLSTQMFLRTVLWQMAPEYPALIKSIYYSNL